MIETTFNVNISTVSDEFPTTILIYLRWKTCFISIGDQNRLYHARVWFHVSHILQILVEKNHIPLIHVIQQEPIVVEKSHVSQWGNRWGPGITIACDGMVPGPQQLPNWELCHFSMGMSSCFYPMIHGNVGHWCCEIPQFPTSPCANDCNTSHRVLLQIRLYCVKYTRRHHMNLISLC